MKSLYNILCINMNNISWQCYCQPNSQLVKKVKKSLPLLENKLHQKEDFDELMHFLISVHLYIKGGWKE